MKLLPAPISTALVKATPRLLRKIIWGDKRYMTTGKSIDLIGDKMTPEIAVEMVYIGMQTVEVEREGILTLNGTATERALMGVAIEVLNNHFKDRDRVSIRDSSTINVSDKDIQDILDVYYSKSTLSKLRKIPKSVGVKGYRF